MNRSRISKGEHSMKLSNSMALLAVLAITIEARAAWTEARPSPVPMPNLPAAAQQSLLEAAGGAGIESIVKWPAFYMIDLTLDGVQKTVRVNEEGTRCDEPRKLDRTARVNQGTLTDWSELPLAVRNLVSGKFQGAPLGEVRRGATVYRATLATGGGKGFVWVTDDGKILPMGKERGRGQGGGPPLAIEGVPSKKQ
jgi:hypothetical protein